MFGLLTSTAPAEEAAKPPPSPLHTAELKMNLSSEKWSPTHGAEIKLHVEMTEEDHARREAVTKRKAKDLAKRTALAEKEAQERRWLKRQEEKARYTEQQRSYFEQQVHESTHKTQEELRLEQEAVIAKGNKRLNAQLLALEELKLKEKEIREGHEKDEAAWDFQWRTNRNKDQLSVRAKELEALRQDAKDQMEESKQAKLAMSQDARTAAIMEARMAAAKFDIGEAVRKGQEESRQKLEESRAQAKALDIGFKEEIFRRDETSRFEYASAKAAKAKKKLNWGKEKQREIESERLYTEREARRKQEVRAAPARTHAQPTHPFTIFPSPNHHRRTSEPSARCSGRRPRRPP